MIISGDDPASKGAQRFEVFTGAGKRRDWPPEVKAAIVAECYSGREGVSAVARRHGLDQRWPGKFGQRDKWIFCLAAAMKAVPIR